MKVIKCMIKSAIKNNKKLTKFNKINKRIKTKRVG